MVIIKVKLSVCSFRGEMAKIIAADVQKAGGAMQLSDLANYKVNKRAPLKSLVKGLKVLSTPAPGSGGLITLALKIMAHFNWTAENQYHDQGLKFHQMVEAFKMAYAPYTFLGDPGFTDHQEKVIIMFPFMKPVLSQQEKNEDRLVSHGV